MIADNYVITLDILMHISDSMKLLCVTVHTPAICGERLQCKLLMDILQGKQGDIVADPLKVTGSEPDLALIHTTKLPSICSVWRTKSTQPMGC